MTFDYNAFKRSFQLNSKTKKYSFFLGAGASIESGVKTATQCIWDWKKSIYDSYQTSIVNADIANDRIKNIVQTWLDKQGIYPQNGSPEEYSFYAEKAYPIPNHRNEYFRSIFQDAKPSIGYKLLVKMASNCVFDKIWTTNFDDMYLKATAGSSIDVIDITTDSTDRIYNSISTNQTMVIKLHGDYKYCDLKNTELELQEQNTVLSTALKEELVQNELVVIGYSGRDKSVMDIFREAIRSLNIKTIYWLGYDKEPTYEVQSLLKLAEENNKEVLYFQAPGFDSIMLDLSYLIFGNNPILMGEIELLKKDYNNKIPETSFSLPDGDPKALIQSNVVYFTMPEIINFVDVSNKSFKINEICKNINNEKDCVCRLYKGLVYFLGNKDKIKSILGKEVVIDSTPLNKDVYRDSKFLRYLIRDVVIKALLNKYNNLRSKGSIIYKIDIKKFMNENCYDAIKLHFGFHNGFPSITINMDLFIENKELDKRAKKNICDAFYFNNLKMQANKNNALYLDSWKDLLFNQPLYFVNESIRFGFTKSFAYGKIVNAKRDYNLSTSYDSRVIQFIANEVMDPKLQFLSRASNEIVEDFHPMRGLVKNKPYENALSSQDSINSIINIAVICPNGYQDQLYGFLSKLNKRYDVERNKEFLITYPGFLQAYSANINIPYKDDSDLWQNYEIDSTCKSLENTKKLYKIIKDKINMINSKCPDAIIIIYIPDVFENLKNYSDNNENFDLHDQTKAYCIPLNIPTQFINEKTVVGSDYAAILWTLSLAIYVKSGRIPWTIENISSSNTAFVGIGYSIDTTNKERPIVLGCSNLYSGDGQSLKYKLSKVKNPQFDEFDLKRENPYLTENEAYDLGCKINDMCHKSFTIYPTKIVIHKRTPFRECEISGLKNSLLRNGVKNIELIEINYSDDLNFTQMKQNLKYDEYSVNRGLAVCVDKDTALLYTHGVAKSVLGESRKYILGGKNIPKPLKIKRYCGNSDLITTCEEILGLTRMNWNSFNLYSKLPCTIESSSIIAKIGYLLTHYDGASFDQRLFM